MIKQHVDAAEEMLYREFTGGPLHVMPAPENDFQPSLTEFHTDDGENFCAKRLEDMTLEEAERFTDPEKETFFRGVLGDERFAVLREHAATLREPGILDITRSIARGS